MWCVYWRIITEFGMEHGKDCFKTKHEADEFANELFEYDYAVKVVKE